MRDIEIKESIPSIKETPNKLFADAYNLGSDKASQQSKPAVDNVFNPVSADVDFAFRRTVEKAWQELPKVDKDTLRQAGVKISVERNLKNEAGSPGIYQPDTKQISIGQKGSAQWHNVSISSDNNDPQGTLKHEVGHALFHLQHLDEWQEFNAIYNRESLNIPIEQPGEPSPFKGAKGPGETFAELYATAQGRNSARTTLLKNIFPELSELVESRFSRNR